MTADTVPAPSPDPFEALRRDVRETATVDVWFIPLEAGEARVREHAALLCAEEARRAARLVRAQHRRRWTIARGAMRALLGGYAQVGARELEFSYGEHGKPALAAHPALHFNLSHSGELAVLAVTGVAPVGVDVEHCLRRVHDMDAVVRRFFSDNEHRAYSRLAPEARRAGFFNGWTRKEAFIKALGSGFATPLGSFDVSLAPGETPRLRRIAGGPAAARDWSLFHLQPAPDYVGAVALRAPGRCRVRELWPGEDAAWGRHAAGRTP